GVIAVRGWDGTEVLAEDVEATGSLPGRVPATPSAAGSSRHRIYALVRSTQTGRTPRPTAKGLEHAPRTEGRRPPAGRTRRVPRPGTDRPDAPHRRARRTQVPARQRVRRPRPPRRAVQPGRRIPRRPLRSPAAGVHPAGVGRGDRGTRSWSRCASAAGLPRTTDPR